MTTLCEECEHLHPTSDKRPPYRWMCMKFKRVEQDNFLTKNERLTEPYMYCQNINGGICPLFEKTKGRQIELINTKGE